MSSDSVLADIARLKSKKTDLLKDLAKEEKAAANSRATANKKRQSAQKTKSSSTQKSALTSASKAENSAADAAKSIGKISGDIAVVDRQIAGKQKALTTAQRSEQRAQDSQDNTRRRKEVSHAREIARVSRPVIQFVPVREPEPVKLSVLYLTASPEDKEMVIQSPDGTMIQQSIHLRVDKEVRAVQQQLRGSKYRELVDVNWIPAASRGDVIQGMNDFRPHVIHFSGHGGAQSLLFDVIEKDEEGSETLDFELLEAALSATTTPPSLLVLNACDSLEGAEALLSAAPIIIAMSDSISDVAAIIFAEYFYAGIASGQSVGASFKQAQVQMRMANLGEELTPEVLCRDDVDIDTLVLVHPV